MNETETIQFIRDKNPGNIFLVFINGYFCEKYSDLHLLPKEISFDQSSGIRVHVDENAKIEKPLHMLLLQIESKQLVPSLQHHILVGKNSELTFIEEYVALAAANYTTNSSLEIIAKENSHIHYHKIQNEDKSATHLATTQIKQSCDSDVNHLSLAIGGKEVRDEISVEQAEPGSSCQLYGLYQLTEDHQQMDQHLYVDHMAQHGKSKIFYKGILDKKSRAAFKGKVHVHPSAQKINAEQANHNLLLSNNAEASSKPELEIYADDVKCTHGSTVGQLDQETLFYLRSRGIDYEAAKKLLLHAFSDEVIRTIKNPDIMQYVRGFI